jgi:Putative Actinobacterial Holin-X, holin superfamily III
MPSLHESFESRRQRAEIDRPSITELVSDLRRESSELIRKEVELAKLEITITLGRIQAGVSAMALGGVAALGGFLFLLAAGAFALDRVLQEPWLSTLIVGAAAILLGVVALALGKSKLDHLAPTRSMESIRQDTQLLQEHLPGGGS